jgi:hypothetical protein
MSLLTKITWLNINNYFEIDAFKIISKIIKPENVKYLPKQISLIIEKDNAFKSKVFLQNVVAQIEIEIQNRTEIIKGLFNSETQIEVNKFLTDITGFQPWIIFESKNGGLPQGHKDLVCCYFVNHHGVANIKNKPGSYNCVLVTARKRDDSWNMDTDIGHEFGHASIAPIPFIAQQKQKQDLGSPSKTILDINLDYPIVESINIILRGEKRKCQTGLAVVETEDDLRVFIKRCKEQFPDCGFQNINANDFINQTDMKAKFVLACMKVVKKSKYEYLS